MARSITTLLFSIYTYSLLFLHIGGIHVEFYSLFEQIPVLIFSQF